MKRFQYKPIRYAVYSALVIMAALGLLAFSPVNVLGQDKIPVPPITSASLVVLLAGALTVIADYFPGVAGWYDTLKPASKRIVMLVGAVVIVGVVFGGQCAGWLETNMVCTPNGLVDVLSNVVLAFAVGQGVHVGSKPSDEFKADVLNINPKKSSKVGI